MVSLVSIVVTLNASLSLFLFEFNPNSTLVPQKKQSVLKEKHYSALRGKERRLLVVSSETDFLARLMLLGRQYSRRQFRCTCCPGTVVKESNRSVLARFIPSLPFSFKVTTSPSPLRLFLQITQFAVSSINCWKSPSEISIGKLKPVSYEGER